MSGNRESLIRGSALSARHGWGAIGGQKLNWRETEIKEQYEKKGWRMLKNGAPDFVALRVEDGQIVDMKGVEVKSPRGKLTYEQGIWKKVFEKANICYRIEVL